MMKLYYAKGACSLSTRIIINELGIACEYERVNFSNKKTEHGQDFNKINPKGLVPTLMLDDGSILTENIAIQQYLADSHHATNLLPELGNFERYRVVEWQSYIAADLHKGIGVFFHTNLSVESRTQVFLPELNHKLHFLNDHLSHHHYLTGENFTVADAYLFVVLSWLPHLEFDITQWPNVHRFTNEVKTRPCVIKALKEEGIGT